MAQQISAERTPVPFCRSNLVTLGAKYNLDITPMTCLCWHTVEEDV